MSVEVSLYTAYGFRNLAEVVDLGGGVGVKTCTDCEGTGIFDFYPEGYNPRQEDLVCCRCKGSGKVKIMLCLPPE